MNVERTERSVLSVDRSAQPLAAVAAAILLVGALAGSPYLSPKWPLWVSVVFLGFGLVAGQLARGPAQYRFAHTTVAVAAMVALIGALAGSPYLSPRWPLWVSVVFLGFGLVAGPLARIAGGQAVQRLPQTVAAVVAVIVLLEVLSSNPYLSPRWPLQVSVVFLGLGLVAGPLAQFIRGGPVHRSAETVAALAALFVLIGVLVGSRYLTPKGPLEVSAMFLALGLVVGPLAQLLSGREKVLSERVNELSRTRRGALDVQASELRRIERDLHDGAQARLVALSMKLGRAEDRYLDDPETAALLREAREDATAAIRELRELARGIAPPVLTDRGLEAAVRSLAQRSGAEVTVSGELGRRPMPAVETAAYFVVAESLTNAAKHAPGARVEIRLANHGGDLILEVTDFGPGGANSDGGGLNGLRQRVEALDGALHVTSPAGVGTQIEAVLPCGW